MKIFISQHYSRNKGNISLLYTLVETIKKEFPNCEITVSSFEPTDTEKTFGYKTCEWPFISRKIADAHGIGKYMATLAELVYVIIIVITALLIRFNLLRLKKGNGRFEALREISESNVVISPGGHLFTNYNKIVPVFAHFFPCFLSVMMKKPYIVMAQTIGPFFGFWKLPAQILTRFVLRHADLVTIRDSNSFEQISALNIKIKDIRQTNELVFLYPENEPVEKSMEMIKLGFTFHHIYYRRWMNKEDYIKRMSDFINKINNRFNYTISFISMEKTVENKSDIPLLQEIKSKLDKQGNVEIITISKNPNELLSVFESLNFLVATKTHSVVYGLRKCIPTLAISYEKKTDDFMKYFNQEFFSVTLSDFNADLAYEKFEQMVEKEILIKKQICDCLKSVQTNALENIKLLEKYQ